MVLIKNQRVWSYNPGAFREIQDGHQDGRRDRRNHSFDHISYCILTIFKILVSKRMFSNTENALRPVFFKMQLLFLEKLRIFLNYPNIKGDDV